MPSGLLIIVFAAATLGFIALFLLFGGSKNSPRERARRRLGIGADKAGSADVPSSILKKDIIQQQKGFKRKLVSVGKVYDLATLLERSKCGIQPGVFIVLSAAMAAIGGGVTFAVNRSIPAAVAAGGVLAVVPFFYVKMKLRRRIKLLTEQFPDALELLTSTLRAGQAFATGLQTVADEMPDPIASEFRATFEEQNYGVSMSDALLHLAERVGTMDMDFFVTAVNIQRETGGNLAEVLDNLGRTIRQRFKILGHIRALTAQGRLSGYIIGLMPIGLGVLLTILNRDYMGLLFTSPTGKLLLGLSVGMQILGFVWINKIVKIKV